MAGPAKIPWIGGYTLAAQCEWNFSYKKWVFFLISKHVFFVTWVCYCICLAICTRVMAINVEFYYTSRVCCILFLLIGSITKFYHKIEHLRSETKMRIWRRSIVCNSCHLRWRSAMGLFCCRCRGVIGVNFGYSFCNEPSTIINLVALWSSLVSLLYNKCFHQFWRVLNGRRGTCLPIYLRRVIITILFNTLN